MKTKIQIWFITALLILISAIGALAQVLIPSKVPLGTERGAAYGYWQTVPADLSTVKGILYFIHGHGERGNGSSADLDKISRIGVQKVIYQGKWTNQNFIVISPQYPVTADKMAAKTLKYFIYHTCAKFDIDTTNVYMLGISGGGITLLNYIVTYPTVKAAVEISGSGSPSKASKAIKTRLWVIHGEDDPVISAKAAIDFVKSYNASNPPVTANVTLIPLYGHEAGVWDKVCASPKFYEWMIKP